MQSTTEIKKTSKAVKTPRLAIATVAAIATVGALASPLPSPRRRRRRRLPDLDVRHIWQPQRSDCHGGPLAGQSAGFASFSSSMRQVRVLGCSAPRLVSKIRSARR